MTNHDCAALYGEFLRKKVDLYDKLLSFFSYLEIVDDNLPRYENVAKNQPLTWTISMCENQLSENELNSQLSIQNAF